MKLPRILFTAMRSGAGKTMLTCGILKAMKMQEINPASFKCGPDYIDPMFHKTVIGVGSYNLDSFLCGEDGVREILKKNGAGADISVLEGVMGYYDGIAGISSKASAYDIARITDTPAVLILDCKGLSVSAVPCVQGFLHYKEDSRIKGVILNRVSPMMYGRMKEMIETQTGVKVYGYVPVMKDCALESRYLGLKLPQERKDTEDKLEQLGEQILKTVDIAGLLELAENAPEMENKELAENASEMEKKAREEHFDKWKAEKNKAQYSTESKRITDSVRIGLASDDAFCFFYQDNLELLQQMGAELIPFSPLHDEKIPENLSGLLFYGGYPELYAEGLSKNESMRTSVKKALEDGMPCMAECGGFMYLQEYIRDESGTEFPMVGFLEGKSYPTGSLKRFGYVTLTGGKIFGKEAGKIPAHEFHYYDSEVCGEEFLAEKPMSKRSWKCMISTDTLLAGYPHIHYYGNEKIPENFLEQCRKYREQKKETGKAIEQGEHRE